ncbi:hypothetical protein OSB04_002300 [Centaurea solstitialis]|uniref:Uncharacterized protein n=1 Tax=Centaurea solstitialis TaxID=347529 RepID=A0AA38TUG6_9ASTR|nr:hypothetical protein OSB04_002300 [Centaurea solstitialis]
MSRSSSRYTCFNNNRSSTQSDPSSSTNLTKIHLNHHHQSSSSSSDYYALAKPKSTKNDQNLTAMVNKFMEKKSKTARGDFVVPAFVADDLKKNNSTITSRRGGTTAAFEGLHKKLFGGGNKGKGEESEGKKKKKKKKKALPNAARTLAMVLTSERELLTQNKDQEKEIADLKLMLDEKNREVDKLKDLCLKQREEIKALKSAILFPDVMNTQLQGLLEKQGSELKQAKQVIPTLQQQVTSLTGQLQCLAEDLAEVKADKYAVSGCYDGLMSSPRTPTYEQEEAINSLEFSSGDLTTTPGSPDDMFLNDLNPCLTPYAKSKSKEFEAIEYHENSSYNNTRFNEIGFGRKLSKSSTDHHHVNSGKILGRAGRRSDENKYTYGKYMHY